MNRDPPSGPGWAVQVRDGDLMLVLSQNWADTVFDPADLEPVRNLLEQGSWKSIRFESNEMGRLGSSLLAFLDSLRRIALRQNIRFDESGLPGPTRQMMQLIPAAAPPADAPRRSSSVVERVGQSVIDTGCEWVASTRLIGQVLLRSGAALRGQANLRMVDVVS
jgi:phospholipid/cholesterol/gamma-HCH transport system permease protein